MTQLFHKVQLTGDQAICSSQEKYGSITRNLAVKPDLLHVDFEVNRVSYSSSKYVCYPSYIKLIYYTVGATV